MQYEFITTKTGKDIPDDINSAVARRVGDLFNDYKTSRAGKEDTWEEAWAAYLGTPIATQYQRDQVLKRVGNVNDDWRHRLNVGKAFESVETIHGYLMAATFPNSDWFNVEPTSPGHTSEAKVIKRYLLNKLKESRFRNHYSNYLRQLLVTGTSVIALPWRYETQPYKRKVKYRLPSIAPELEREEWRTVVEQRIMRNSPEFELLDVFDVFIDPHVPDPNDGNFIRVIHKTKSDIINSISRGIYKDLDPYTVACMTPDSVSTDTNVLYNFQGIDTPEPYRLQDIVQVVEFWGDIHLDGITYHDVTATVIGGNLVNFEPNPFWAGKPFIVGSCITVPKSPYGIGVVEPNLGLLHQLNIITNQRLDNIELSIDEMYTVKAGGLITEQDVSSEPGKTFLVNDHDDIRPIPRGQQAYVVTYQEGAVLEQTIDKNVGTGALVSANNARSGERVTAAEIQAVRDAGGNRLSNLHKHIEESTLLPLLAKLFRSCQQFIDETEIVRVSGENPGQFDYYEVGIEDFQFDYKLYPLGADHVTDREKYVRQRLELLQIASQIPQAAELLNYELVFTDILNNMGFNDPERYISKPATPTAPMEGIPEQTVPGAVPTPQQPPAEPTVEDEMYNIGGVPLQEAMKAEMQQLGMPGMAQKYANVNATGEQL